jgi:hypothetical protein
MRWGRGGEHSVTSQTHAAGGAPFTTQVRGSKRRRPACTLYEPAAARIRRPDRAAIRSTAPSRSASANAYLNSGLQARVSSVELRLTDIPALSPRRPHESPPIDARHVAARP